MGFGGDVICSELPSQGRVRIRRLIFCLLRQKPRALPHRISRAFVSRVPCVNVGGPPAADSGAHLPQEGQQWIRGSCVANSCVCSYFAILVAEVTEDLVSNPLSP